MKLLRFVLDAGMFYAAYAWPPVLVAYAYVHFCHAELVYLPRRLDQWSSPLNPRLWH